MLELAHAYPKRQSATLSIVHHIESIRTQYCYAIERKIKIMGKAEPEGMTVDAATSAEAINALIAKLHAHYVFPAVAQQIEADLRQQLATGKYESETPVQPFCDDLTQTLQAISNDKHLNVRYSAEAHLPANDGQSSVDTVTEDAAWREAYREERRLHNYGFARVERLPGNVGYLDLRAFEDPAIGGEAAIAAMNLLAHASALIIDLRQNGGGWPEMVALLTTYLFDQEIVHLNSLYWRHGDKTQQFWTLPYVPGSRFGGKKPVYVLTSSQTFSGAEEFAYNLQQLKRATIIGEITGGGANPGDWFSLTPHFAAFIPTGRAINPISQDDWEGRGVVPDIAVPQEQAFDVALVTALKAISAELRTAATDPLAQLSKEAQEALAQMESKPKNPLSDARSPMDSRQQDDTSWSE
jgi:retinol-binding protein 3